jgi:antitoxin CptB
VSLVSTTAVKEKGPDPVSVGQLRWRCRRGMRELDAILQGFVERGLAGLDAREKRRFAEILEFPDPDLHAYLVGKASPSDPDLARLVECIRASVSVQA